jgi:carbonic anhydrase
VNFVDAQEALAKLKEGNERYVSGIRQNYSIIERRKELVEGQHPFATILSCSDSRVVPEYIFDAKPGELFIVRTAGNIAGPIDLGSLEYGCEHLHTPVLIVMGHEKCGAVSATCQCKGDSKEGNIRAIVEEIAPAAKKENFDASRTILCNIECSIENIRKRSKIISHLEKEGKLKIIGAMYSLESGKVEFL